MKQGHCHMLELHIIKLGGTLTPRPDSKIRWWQLASIVLPNLPMHIPSKTRVATDLPIFFLWESKHNLVSYMCSVGLWGAL